MGLSQLPGKDRAYLGQHNKGKKLFVIWMPTWQLPNLLLTIIQK